MNWAALISAACSIGSIASMAAGMPALGAIFANPTTATIATGAVGLGGAIVSAMSQGVQHPATSVTVPAVAVDHTSPALTPDQKSAVIAIKSDPA